MTDQWDSLPSGIAYAGDAKRERPLLALEGLGPWGGSVTVTPIPALGRLGTQFAVDVQWTGPPLATPPLDADDIAVSPSWDGPAVTATDCYYTGDQQLAMAIGRVAGDALRRPQRPLLRSIAAELKRRK